ncbi:hypothetical protein PCE1_001902 [Barthelona sp. PCE]
MSNIIDSREFKILEEIHRSHSTIIQKAYWIQRQKFVILKECLGVSGDFFREYDIVRSLDHPHIVQTYGFYHNSCRRSIVLVLEYCERGDLLKLIKERRSIAPAQHFTHVEIFNLAQQVTSALQYLHQRNIIHRDVKAPNIFITADGNYKLGDFGVSRLFEDDEDFATTFLGTPLYLSPEICDGMDYTVKTDIWSLGVVLFEVVALAPPFVAPSIPALMTSISKLKFSNDLPINTDPLHERLLLRLLTRERKRPSARRLGKWLAKHRVELCTDTRPTGTEMHSTIDSTVFVKQTETETDYCSLKSHSTVLSANPLNDYRPVPYQVYNGVIDSDAISAIPTLDVHNTTESITDKKIEPQEAEPEKTKLTEPKKLTRIERLNERLEAFKRRVGATESDQEENPKPVIVVVEPQMEKKPVEKEPIVEESAAPKVRIVEAVPKVEPQRKKPPAKKVRREVPFFAQFGIRSRLAALKQFDEIVQEQEAESEITNDSFCTQSSAASSQIEEAPLGNRKYDFISNMWFPT